MVNQTINISHYQPMLQAIAYRMVGCMHDAEDIVQDTFLKYLTVDHEKINNIKAYLIRSVTNNCLNHVNSIRQKKKEYLESVKLPELFEKIDFSHLDLKHELELALEVMHKKLGPLERAVFMLREGFDFDYEELQEIFNKKKEHCRQLVSRAKEKLAKEAPKMTLSLDKNKLFEAFRKASSQGQFNELIEHISAEHPVEQTS